MRSDSSYALMLVRGFDMIVRRVCSGSDSFRSGGPSRCKEEKGGGGVKQTERMFEVRVPAVCSSSVKVPTGRDGLEPDTTRNVWMLSDRGNTADDESFKGRRVDKGPWRSRYLGCV